MSVPVPPIVAAYAMPSIRQSEKFRVFQAPAEAIQIPEYSGDLHVATERLVKAAHSHNLEVHVWTVNDIEDMQRLLDIGVDGIITDRPDRLLELVGQH